MSMPTIKEYHKMLASVETELAHELALDPSLRDHDHVDECLETLVFIRERIDRLERQEADRQQAKPARGLRARPALRRALIIAAIVAAVLACGMAIAEAVGLRIGETLFRLSPQGLRLDEGFNYLVMSEDASTSGPVGLLCSSADRAEERRLTEAELRSALGSRLLYPEDTAGFTLEYAEFTPAGRNGGEAVLHMRKDGRRITVVQQYYNEDYRPDNHAGAFGLFDSFDNVETISCGGYEYSVAVGRQSGAASFRIEGVSCTVYGRADRRELETIVNSMLRNAKGSTLHDAAPINRFV